MSEWNKDCFPTAYKYLHVSAIYSSESTKVKGLFLPILAKRFRNTLLLSETVELFSYHIHWFIWHSESTWKNKVSNV